MATFLTVAAVMALAIRPDCGAAKPGSDLADRLVATARAESSLDPFSLHINGPDGGTRHYKSEIDAIVAALELDATNIDYDLGLMQINRRNLERHGLTLRIGSAFDPCTNMRAGTDHLVDDVRAVWNLASRRYNCGRIDCGSAYAQRVDAMVARGDAVIQPSATTEAPTPISPPDQTTIFARKAKIGRELVINIKEK